MRAGHWPCGVQRLCELWISLQLLCGRGSHSAPQSSRPPVPLPQAPTRRAAPLGNSSGALGSPGHGRARLRFLRHHLGFKAKSVLDIGANVGDWTRVARRIFPEASFLLVEADPRHAPALAETGLPFEIALLASRPNETVTFHTTRHWLTSGASLFPERTELYSDPHLSRPLQLRTRALDEVVAEHFGDASCCDFLKADVQGAEIEVLRGGARTLRNAKLVLLEAAVLPFNEGAPRFSELVAFMAAADFEIVDIVDAAHCEGVERVLQLDVLFAPRESPLLRYPLPTGIRHQPG
mmetsp:Transcript_115650/g.326975  ORF Transcript_115650/g.326975 Transcript_115650/m.326975 type:complete len:294 (-) Transcript_115650:53-934(-)